MDLITKENWREKVVIPLLYQPLTTGIKMKVDSFEFKLFFSIANIDEPIFGIDFFVDGECKYEWQGELKPGFAEIQKRFLHKRKIQISQTPGNIKKYGKNSIKLFNKENDKLFYVLRWPSLTALKNNLFKNSKTITFIERFSTVTEKVK